ncbi:tripartite motif-containing protein 66-like [Mercenaria mercenaria]|uniref:tripartite motif-containing protein 66-like n=1 Tax=Mercenaria mercenaria TaxID=6596 RepID=UPI00234EA149|nr:tripartite motif-containing protein 66-like [Mercenaria mercenaria]
MAAARSLGRSQIDASDAFYEYTCVTCAADSKNTEALYKCIECQVFYCVRCVAGHNKFTVNHHVVDRKSEKFRAGRKETPVYDSSEMPKDVCQQHHGEVIKMYCGQHNIVCCTVCIAVQHRNCYGVDYIPKIAKGLLKGSEKGETTATLEKVRSDLQRQMYKLQKDRQTLNKQRDNSITEIRHIKKRIIARVEQLERMSITELETKHEEISGEINHQSKKVENMLKAVETRLDKLKGNQIITEAQLFVDIKFGNLQAQQGQDCIKQTSKKSFEQIEFEPSTKILSILHDTQAFGMLTGYVDVLVPEETEVTRAFLGSLQDELKRSKIK